MAEQPPDLDLQGILSKSVTPATLADLDRQGHKRVFVLNKETVKTLIAQAVERAIESRSRDRVAEALRIEAERGRAGIEQRAREHEEALGGRRLEGGERARLEAELAAMRETLAEHDRLMAEEKKRLVEASKTELDRLMAASRQQQENPQIGALKSQLDHMAGDLERFKAGLTIELTKAIAAATVRAPGASSEAAASVASRHVAEAFEEPLESNLDAVTPGIRRSGAGAKLAGIRRRLEETRHDDQAAGKKKEP